MTPILAAVMWISFACVISASPPTRQGHQLTEGQVQLPSEFVGDPATIQQMRLSDGYWVPAHALCIDTSGSCWINKHQRLDEQSLHMIQVHRFHEIETNRVLYGVRIERERLQGWMWELGDHEGDYFEATGHLPVFMLDVSE